LKHKKEMEKNLEPGQFSSLHGAPRPDGESLGREEGKDGREPASGG